MKAAYMINVTDYEEGQKAPFVLGQRGVSWRKNTQHAQRAIALPPAPAQETAPDPTKVDTPPGGEPHLGASGADCGGKPPVAAPLAALVADCARNGSGALSLPRIVRASDFTAKPLDKPSEVIHGVLYRGGKLVFGGPSKSYKTWDLIDLGLAVATGSEWLGFGTTAGNALYINLELAEFSSQHRIIEVARAKRCAVPSTMSVWNLRGHACPLADLLPELMRQMEGDRYDLIIVDPIYKTLSGRDENDAGAIGEVCNEIEAVAVRTGAAVAFGAHFAKGNASGKSAMDRIGGSGVFARDPDAILTATPHTVEGAFTLELTLRDFPPVGPFAIRWEYPRMKRDGDLNPGDLKQPNIGRKPTFSVDDIMRHIGSEPLTATAWEKASIADSGFSRPTFCRLRKEAEGKKLIEKEGQLWRRRAIPAP